MIIFRKQKEYSEGITKAIYKLLKIQDKIDTWGANIGEKARRTATNNRDVPRIYKPKSNTSLKREALELRNNIRPKNIVNSTVVKVKPVTDAIKYGEPEDLSSMVGRSLAKRPFQTIATAATFPLSGAAIEEGLRKIKPYKKGTEAAGKFYDKHLDKLVRKGTNTVVNIVKAIPK